MSNILTTSFSYSVYAYRQLGFAISPSSAPTYPSITGSPQHYSTMDQTSGMTGSYTVPSASNQVLFVTEYHLQGGSTLTATYGGVSMSVYAHSGDGGGWNSYIFYLINPTVGIADVVISYGGNLGNMSTMGIFTTQDTNQTTPINSLGNDSNSGSSTSLDVPNVVNYSLLFSYVGDYGFSGAITNTTGGGQSELWNYSYNTNKTMSSSTKQADILPMTSVNDTISITENINFDIRLSISVTNSLTCSESLTFRETISIPNLFDSLSFIENIIVTPPHFEFSPFENEYLNVTENIKINIPINISVIETLTITENYHVPDPSVLLVGLIIDSLTLFEIFIIDTFRFTVGRSQIGKLGISL